MRLLHSTETLIENKVDLDSKKSELSEIISETEKEEKELMKKSELAQEENR